MASWLNIYLEKMKDSFFFICLLRQRQCFLDELANHYNCSVGLTTFQEGVSPNFLHSIFFHDANMTILLQVVNDLLTELKRKKVDGFFFFPFNLKFMYNLLSFNKPQAHTKSSEKYRVLLHLSIKASLPFYLFSADIFLNFLFCLYSKYLHIAAPKLS